MQTLADCVCYCGKLMEYTEERDALKTVIITITIKSEMRLSSINV